MSKNILLFISSFLFAFIFFEGLANFLDISPKPLASLDLKSFQVSSDPVIRFEYQPNYGPERQPYDGDHRGFKINSVGFRDYEREIEKPKNVKRILLLGDSTTAGNGVSDFNKIYSALLEKTLNNQNSETKFEVLNMAVGGYHTLQEVQTLKEKGLKYKPDLVFIVLCLNDFMVNADGGVFMKLKELYQDKSKNVDLSISNSIIKRSRLAFALYHRLGFSKNMNWEDSWYEQSVLKGKTPVHAGFELVSELQNEHKFKTVVFILPQFKNTLDQYARHADHEKVKAAASNVKGLVVIDLLKHFAKYDFNLKKFSYDSCHMNENGHKVMAQILNPIVKKLLPESYLLAKIPKSKNPA